MRSRLIQFLCFVLLARESRGAFDHNEQNCIDVSYYGPVIYKDDVCQKCETEFENVCTNRVETVCDSVTDTTCRIQAFTECTMYTQNVEYDTTEMVPDGSYIPYECHNSTRLEPHVKKVPVCVNVTRQDCVTKWEVNAFGQKVWAGNEDCTPVTWQNCTLTDTTKLFNQTYTECRRTGIPIPTTVCKPTKATKQVMGTRCQVKHVKACDYITSQKCTSINVKECEEAAKPISCQNTQLRVPTQEKIHRVKCLLTGLNDSPHLDVNQSAENAEKKLKEAPLFRRKRRILANGGA